MFFRNVSETLLTRLQAAFVGVVSLYDAWLVVRYSGVIREIEENPVGVAMIHWADGGVGLFIATKLAGSALVVGILFYLISHHQNLARPVVNAITAFQFWLLWYLTMTSPGDPAIPVVRQILILVMLGCCLTPFLELRPRRPIVPGPSHSSAIPARLRWSTDRRRCRAVERHRAARIADYVASRGSIIRRVIRQARNDTIATETNGIV